MRWQFGIKMSSLVIYGYWGYKVLHIRGGMGLIYDGGTIVSRSYRVYPHCSHQDQARPGHHSKTIQEIVGAYDSSVQQNIFWPAVHKTPAVVPHDQGILP